MRTAERPRSSTLFLLIILLTCFVALGGCVRGIRIQDCSFEVSLHNYSLFAKCDVLFSCSENELAVRLSMVREDVYLSNARLQAFNLQISESGACRLVPC